MKKTYSNIIEDISTYSYLGKGGGKYAFQIVKIHLKNSDGHRLTYPRHLAAIGIDIDEAEILIGSCLKEELHQKGEEVSDHEFLNIVSENKDGLVWNKCWIEPTDKIEILRNKKSHLLKPYKKIKKVFQVERNGQPLTGIRTNNKKPIFWSSKNLSEITGLDPHEFQLLAGAYIYPIFFQKGDNIYEGTDRKPEKCRKNNTLVKTLNLRLPFKLKNKRQNLLKSQKLSRHQKNKNGPVDYIDRSPYQKYGGPRGYDDKTIDDAFGGIPSAIWNVE